MPRVESAADLDRTDAAFNRVLRIEAEAREALEDARRQAAARAASAGERARAVERRTEARLLCVHRLADASVARALDALAAEGAAQVADAPDTDAADRLERMVAILADEMIGAPAGLLDERSPGGKARS